MLHAAVMLQMPHPQTVNLPTTNCLVWYVLAADLHTGPDAHSRLTTRALTSGTPSFDIALEQRHIVGVSARVSV